MKYIMHRYPYRVLEVMVRHELVTRAELVPVLKSFIRIRLVYINDLFRVTKRPILNRFGQIFDEPVHIHADLQ